MNKTKTGKSGREESCRMFVKPVYKYLLLFVHVPIMFTLCSCSTMQTVQSSLSDKLKLREFYDSQNSTHWSEVIATNTTVTATEFLRVLSSYCKPVQDVLAKYSQPDYIHLIAYESSINNWSDIVVAVPQFRITLLYHKSTNIVVYVNQRTGNVRTDNLEDEMKRITELMDKEPNVERIWSNPSFYKIRLHDPTDGEDFLGPWELFEICYQRRLIKDKLEDQKRVRQEEEAKVIADQLERKRLENLPKDQEIERLIIGKWKYEGEQRTESILMTEKMVVDYNSNKTFTVVGKISVIGGLVVNSKECPVSYSGTWEVNDRQIIRTIQSIVNAGDISVRTPLFVKVEPYIKMGHHEEDIIQSIFADRISTTERRNPNNVKFLMRMEHEVVATLSKTDRIAALYKKAEAVRNTTLVFKGMYIGMPIKDAAAQLSLLLDMPEVDNPSELISGGGRLIESENSGIRVKADSSETVIEFLFLKKCVDRLFDSKGVPVKTFTKNFEHAYDLPAFEHEAKDIAFLTRTIGFQNVWTSTSEKGFMVLIYDDATIIDRKRQLELMSIGQGQSIEPGTLLIRKIGKAKFD